MSVKEDFFVARTNAHIARVQRNAQVLATRYREISQTLLEQAESHDCSKYEHPERDPYIELTWNHRCWEEGVTNSTSSELQAQIDAATLYHITTNKHHPEYWDPDWVMGTIVDATRMDKVSIAEMCCDWVAMSQEKYQSDSAHKWANTNIGKRWRFTDEQVGWVYQFLDTLGEKE